MLLMDTVGSAEEPVPVHDTEAVPEILALVLASTSEVSVLSPETVT